MIKALALKNCLICLCVTGIMISMATEAQSLSEELMRQADMVVDPHGGGDYTSVQEAIDAAPDNSAERTVILIMNGTYREKVLVASSKRNLTLVGEHTDSTVLVYDDYAGRVVNGDTLNTFTSQTIRVDADDFRAMNMTFENDARPDGSGTGQNVAISIYGARAVLLHCRLISWQDTYYTGSDDRHYLKDCYIEGAVDYIFGHTTVIFDSCQIQTVRTGGYITAASTLENYQFGYVFFGCRITAPPGISGVYLGRPWKTYARTVFFECTEMEHISPFGWHTWGGRENTCYYAEYRCAGPGSETGLRVDWSHQLTDEEALSYTREQIFSAASSSAFSQDWDPRVDSDSVWQAVRAHTVMFIDPINTDSRIETLLVDGEPLEYWDPSVFEVPIEVGAEPGEMPVLSATAVNPLSEVNITYPDAVPGFAEITVLANDGGSHSTYRIYFSVNGSYTEARLDSIMIAGEILEGFSPDVYEYEVVLPADVSKYWGLTGYPRVGEAWVMTSKPASLPGDATIAVTAVDGITSAVYTLHISLATGLEVSKEPEPGVRVIYPVREQLHLQVVTPISSPLRVKIMELNGAVVSEHMFAGSVQGTVDLYIPVPRLHGLFFYEVAQEGWRKIGKFFY